ncbi:hypothetical protein QR64_11480 [Rhodococcus sp. Chr-9]|nr:hypothetical protein QR64_11480 [Rhodococcus sp. Chr-9]OBA35105.1 hypothetical protein A5767_12440 [Rhodococcus sp. 852002-51564_SCH6189132-a]QQM51531.1 hypothetical protein JGU70_13045 [Rhodococcus pyridinivorans]
MLMVASTDKRSDSMPRSNRRILAIIALTGMLTIGFLAAVFTASYLIGAAFAMLTGACIVLAHLMIAPASIIHDDETETAIRPEIRERWHPLGSES